MSKYALIAFSTFTPTFVATYVAVDISLKIILSGAMPGTLSGLRIRLTIAIILLVVTEMLVTEFGIGAFILEAGPLYDLERLFVALAS